MPCVNSANLTLNCLQKLVRLNPTCKTWVILENVISKVQHPECGISNIICKMIAFGLWAWWHIRRRWGDLYHIICRCCCVYKNRAYFLTLFLLHPAVLEPNFHLSFVELENSGNFHSPGPGQVPVEMELLLELCQLLCVEVGTDYILLTRDSIFWNCRS